MAFDPDALVNALAMVMSLQTMAWMMAGVIVGVGVGAIPGLQSSTAVALVLPLSFSMPLAPALGLLIGLYKGSVYGGSIAAISFATPGAPESAASIADGHTLTLQGKGKKALMMALYASVTADLLSDLVTILLAPALAQAALQFGPAERGWVLILAITLVGALSGRNLAAGLFSAALGLFIATIGSDPVGLVPRNTFGLWWLRDGIPLPPLVIGLFAMAMVFEKLLDPIKEAAKKSERLNLGSEGLTFREYLRAWKEMMIGFVVGTVVGVLPGLGATVGAFLSYSIAKQASPQKRIGKGALEGVAAAEAGNNATVGPTLVPLIAFGIPGSTTAALIGGALTLQGITPSPRMFDLFPEVIYALFLILLIANFANLLVGRLFATLYARLADLPTAYLTPMIGLFAVVGTYAYQSNPYHVVMMLVMGLIGLIFRLVRIPEAPLVITVMVAGLAESNLRKAYVIGGNDWISAMFNSSLSIGLVGLCILSLVASVRFHVRQRHT